MNVAVNQTSQLASNNLVLQMKPNKNGLNKPYQIN